MQIKKSLLVLSILSSFVLSAYAATNTFKVNGVTVSQEEQEGAIKAMVSRGAKRTDQLEKAVQYKLSQDAILYNIGMKEKINEKDDVKKAIELATRQIVVNATMKDWMSKNPVSKKDVMAAYEKEKQLWGDTEVEIQHILVKDEATAKGLLKRIKKGENFAKLAKAHSLDSVKNKEDGGIIHWVSPNILPKELKDALPSLGKGKVASSPIKTAMGWHVLKFLNKRPQETYKDFSKHEKSLALRVMQQKVQTYLRSLVNDAKIEPDWRK